jgi:hypothetical protein
MPTSIGEHRLQHPMIVTFATVVSLRLVKYSTWCTQKSTPPTIDARNQLRSSPLRRVGDNIVNHSSGIANQVR